MKRSWVLLVFFAASVTFAGEQPEKRVLALSLKRAVQLAMAPEGNAQIQLSDEASKQAKARSAEARAALLPNIASSLTYRDQTTNLRAFGLGFNIPTVPGFSFSFPSLVGPSVSWMRASQAHKVSSISARYANFRLHTRAFPQRKQTGPARKNKWGRELPALIFWLFGRTLT